MSSHEEIRDKKWEKLLQKLSKHQKSGGSLLLMPDEVLLLNAKLFELTRQLLNMMQFHEKYQPLMNTFAEMERVEAARGNEDPDATDRGDAEEHLVSVPDADDPEGLRPVAGNA